MKTPNLYELLLVLIYLNEKEFRGKTNVHKNLYLLQKMCSELTFPFKFKPYFYGPFSPEISEGLDFLENVGLIKVKEIEHGIKDSFEVRQFVYRLSEEGEFVAKRTISTYGKFMEVFENQFKKLKATGYNENTKVLSTAAKVKHVLSEEKQPQNYDSIIAKAKDLGWKIKANDLKASAEMLIATNLARRTSPKK